MHAAPASPPPPAACLRRLPPVPAALPAPVALDAGCGLVVLGPGARASLRPRPHVSYPPGAQAAPGEGVTFRGGHVVLVRAGRVVWRSQRTFHPGHHAGVFTNILDAAASGSRLAFAVSRWWGRPVQDHPQLFVATLGGAERRVAATAMPLGWTPRGLVTSEATARRLVLRVVGADGRPAAPPRVLPTRTWAWDWATSRVVAVSGDRVVRSDGVRVRTIARLSGLGLARAGRGLWVSPLGHGLLEVATQSRLVVLDAAGRVRSAASLPTGWRLQTLGARPDGAVAFEAVRATATAPGGWTRLYAALPGAGRRLLGGYHVPPSCASDGVALRGDAVLVAGPGIARAYDLRRPGRAADLEPAVRFLRVRHRAATAAFYPWT